MEGLNTTPAVSRPTEEPFRTFFCYRRARPDAPHFAASEETAAYIYKHRDDLFRGSESARERAGRILFEEKTESVNYKQDIAPILPEIRYFFVFLCPGFFDRVLFEFHEKCHDSYEEMKRYAAEADNIPFLEIDTALACPQCRLRIVYVNYGNESAEEYLSAHVDALRAAFGGRERWERLQTNTNSPVITYHADEELRFPACIYESLVQCFSEKPDTNEMFTERMAPFWSDLKQMHDRFLSARQGRNCTMTLCPEDNEMDWNAYRRFKDMYPSLYHIPHGYIEGVDCIEGRGRSPFFGMGFNDVKKACGPFSTEVSCRYDPYTYWPIAWNDDGISGERPSISICAICFGALLLNNYLKNDSRAMERYSMTLVRKIDDGEIRHRINGALNLLITLRDYAQFCWMSNWNFHDGTAGTINQTTLSLSTIIECGFLGDNFATDAPTERAAQLEMRFRYISESIHWLDSQKRSIADGYCWTCGPTEISQEENMTLTVFCFEVYMKYAIRLAGYLQTASLTKERRAEWQNELAHIRETLEEVIDVFAVEYAKMNDAPSVAGDCIFEKGRQALCDRAMVARAVITYLNNFEGIYRGASADAVSQVTAFTLPKVKALIRKIVRHLYYTDEKHLSECEVKEALTVIALETGKPSKESEQYEHCGHLMCIEALIKAASKVNECGIDGISPTDIREKALRLLEIYRREHCNPPTLIAGVGKGDSVHYPLYAAYYYRMAITDCERYFGPSGR